MTIMHVYGCSLHLIDIFGCSPCPAGHFCGAAGLTRSSGLCQAGFYCPGGDTKPTGRKVCFLCIDLCLWDNGTMI